MSNYRYFTDEETKGLDKELCAMLDVARDKAGVPFTITCGLRTADQNACLHGAVADSAHLTGLAVDLAMCGDDHIRERMEFGLCAAGFVRRGTYFKPDVTNPVKLIPHHIHVDIDTSKPQQFSWALIEQN